MFVLNPHIENCKCVHGEALRAYFNINLWYPKNHLVMTCKDVFGTKSIFLQLER